MTSVSSGRRRGLNASTAIKSPVIAASTANLILSAEQTVDGIALVDGDRVLVKNQTDGTENGIYNVDTSTWQREPDWDGAGDVVEGTMVPVSRGTTNADTIWKITTTGDITIGSTDITIAVGTSLSNGNAITVTDVTDSTSGSTGSIHTAGGIGAVKDIVTDATLNAAGDTAAGDNAAMGYTATEGLILTGQGSTSDVTIKNDADAEVMSVATGTTIAAFASPIVGGACQLQTPTATTSGTAHDYTSIPSWVKKISVMLSGVGTDGTGQLQIVLGDSGGFETGGYNGGQATNGAGGNHGAGFQITPALSAANTYTGLITLVLSNSSNNIWAMNGVIARTDGNGTDTAFSAGDKALSGALTQIRLNNASGATFDAGAFNVLYE